ncbi:MAG: energy-coupled thiamine transporter ThiT [Clostridiales bacterium]|nr:MAG: energy-coupled thiamine transporter ThiT [Clostridiales bacterium]
MTIGSMVPVMIIAFMYSTKWEFSHLWFYTVLNMIFQTGCNHTSHRGVRLIRADDYSRLRSRVRRFRTCRIFFYRLMGSKRWAMPVSAAIVTFLRFLCHFASGIILWGSYAPEGQPVWIYSIFV